MKGMIANIDIDTQAVICTEPTSTFQISTDFDVTSQAIAPMAAAMRTVDSYVT